ncbi:MFS transporter, partial [Arthrobacter sp. H14]|uniref:MFS transporter n=1 Tax=Arthrobacter sp. H14 TaxID=1312959 RepID=UPI00055A1D86
LAGMLAAMAGALLVVASTVLGSLTVLLTGTALIGVGAAANLQARFAAVDLAGSAHRGRDLSIVVWAITVGAVAGPNLIEPGAVVGRWLGLPEIAGPFVIAAGALAVASMLLGFGLRPDPLLTARVWEDEDRVRGKSGSAAPAAGRTSLRAGLGAVRASRPARLAFGAIVAAHAVMVAVMSMTPLHLQQLGAAHESTGSVEGAAGAAETGTAILATDEFAIIGFTISLHIAGMYALSPVMGSLADRFGRRRTMLLGQILLVVAAALAGFGYQSQWTVAAGLVALGLGWSAVTIAGSTLLAESVAPDQKVVVQGLSDMMMSAAGAVGGAVSGVILSLIGFTGLTLVSGALAAFVGFLVVAALLRRRVSVTDYAV